MHYILTLIDGVLPLHIVDPIKYYTQNVDLRRLRDQPEHPADCERCPSDLSLP